MVRFAILKNFFDPVLTNDGKPYAPQRYKQIIKERYIIAKNAGTPYAESGQITPYEREQLLELIADEFQKTQEYIDSQKKKQ